MTFPYENLKKDEDIVAFVVKGLRAQGGFGFDTADGSCVYRTPQGKRCAVGLLMPDVPEMDELVRATCGINVMSITQSGENEIASNFLDWVSHHQIILSRLQAVHDEHAGYSAGQISPQEMQTWIDDCAEAMEELVQ